MEKVWIAFAAALAALNDEAVARDARTAAGADGGLPKRKATVETLCASNLLKLDRDVLLAAFMSNLFAVGLPMFKRQIKRHVVDPCTAITHGFWIDRQVCC